MMQLSLKEVLELVVAEPDQVLVVPTFDAKLSRELTPMLKARFDYAATFRRGREVWLSASEMASCVKQKTVQGYHHALRENWDDSAPMLFSDERLALFGITEGVPENLVYLAWVNEGDEPEVWAYADFQTQKFANLVQYLTWCLERE